MLLNDVAPSNLKVRFGHYPTFSPLIWTREKNVEMSQPSAGNDEDWSMKRSKSDRGAVDERDDAAESSAVRHHELLATTIRTCPQIDEKSCTLYYPSTICRLS